MTPSDSIEATAPTVDQAISHALDQLGAHQDDVTIEVLSTPRSGVLGLGARPARVRVTRRAPEIARSAVQSPPPAPPLKRTPPETRPSAMPSNPPEFQSEPRSDWSRAAPSAATRAPQPPAPPRLAEEDSQEDFEADREAAPPPISHARESEFRQRPNDAPDASSANTDSNERPRRGRNFRGGRRRDDRSSPPHGQGRNQDRQSHDQNRGGNSNPADTEESLGASSISHQESSPDSSNGRREGPRPDRRHDSRRRRDRDRPPRSAGDERRTDTTPPNQRPERPRREDSTASAASDREADLDSFIDDGSGSDQRSLIAPEEQIAEAAAILADVLKMMAEQAEIEVVRDEGLQTVELNIKGDGSGILIGRHGQTLDAIEYVVNRILGRRIKDAVNIAIDTESYRARRRGQLHRMALSKGEQAKREHVTVTLDPMAPRDRRIIHLALKDDPLITTRSFGDGFLRSIEIVPVNGSRDRDERDRRDRRDRSREPDRDRDREDDLPLGQQGGFKHGQKRIV
jgi:spoIIIJ-associated protein